MRLFVDIVHPGHVHFFKHVIWRLQKQGHEVLITARAKDVTLTLLEHYGFAYHSISTISSTKLGLFREFLQREQALIKLIRQFNPDVVAGIAGLSIAPACWLLRKPSIVFTDSEPVPLDKYLTYPFARYICTPDCFMRDLGNHHVRYAGYHELAYLSPNYFQPDPGVLDELGVSEGESFIVLRFVAWKASHDVGQHGFSVEIKRKIIQTLSQYGRVFITSETPLPEEFEPYRINVLPHRIHHVLYYASLFMGDGATMATEAGILGTPAVRSSSLALNMGNFVELMERYQLVYSYSDSEEALRQSVLLLEQGDAKEKWQQRREKLLAEKIDVTSFVTELITKSAVAVNIAEV